MTIDVLSGVDVLIPFKFGGGVCARKDQVIDDYTDLSSSDIARYVDRETIGGSCRQVRGAMDYFSDNGINAIFLFAHGAGVIGHGFVDALDYVRKYRDGIPASELPNITKINKYLRVMRDIIAEEMYEAEIPVDPNFDTYSLIQKREGKIGNVAIDGMLRSMSLGYSPLLYAAMVPNIPNGNSDIFSVCSADDIIYEAMRRFSGSSHRKVVRGIMTTSVDGVYDCDPTKNPDAVRQLILDEVRVGELHGLGGSAGVDVSGGMEKKVNKAQKYLGGIEPVAAGDMIVNIVAGNDDHSIYDALTREFPIDEEDIVGTLVTGACGVEAIDRIWSMNVNGYEPLQVRQVATVRQ